MSLKEEGGVGGGLQWESGSLAENKNFCSLVEYGSMYIPSDTTAYHLHAYL